MARQILHPKKRNESIMRLTASKKIEFGEDGHIASLKDAFHIEFLSDTKLPLFTFFVIADGERREYTAADFPVCNFEKSRDKVVFAYTGLTGGF